MSVSFRNRSRPVLDVERLEGRVAMSVMAAPAPTVLSKVNPKPVVLPPVVVKPVIPIHPGPVQSAKPVQRDPLDLTVPILGVPSGDCAFPVAPLKIK